jgi:hypothetical protein
VDREFAHSLLMGVAYAARPLSPAEVVTAAFNVDISSHFHTPEKPRELQIWPRKQIQRVSYQLLEVVGSVVQFRHFSVMEFLLNERLWTPEPGNEQERSILRSLELLRDPSRANACLARVCLTYLLAPCFDGSNQMSTTNAPTNKGFTRLSAEIERKLPWETEDYDLSYFTKHTSAEYPLLRYAIRHGLGHIKDVEGSDGTHELGSLLQRFLGSGALWTWLCMSSILIDCNDPEWLRSISALELLASPNSTSSLGTSLSWYVC